MTHVVKLIAQKRDGRALSPDQIRSLIDGYTAGDVPDYQMSAFLMAAFLRGLDHEETLALTRAMLESGTVLDLSDVPGIKVDKHSTGGVGDKVSLILAPLVAACGVPVPMISGRGLGHSGGTLDKLESIPGFRVDLSLDAYRRQLAEIGVVMIGQTAEIAPADRKIYALRDVTATVASIPFMTSSILSKKLAEGIDALVLDVKWGRGAFMTSLEDGRALAEKLVEISEAYGKPSVALLTDMNNPLGRGIGNWPETAEAIRCLHGEPMDDVLEVTLALAGEMLCLGGVASTPEEGVDRASRALAEGQALDRMRHLVEVQGGDVRVVDNPDGLDPGPWFDVVAERGGRVDGFDARALGELAVALGAGRRRKEDAVDPLAGIVLSVQRGDTVQPGQVLARLHTRYADEDRFQEPLRAAVLLAGSDVAGDAKRHDAAPGLPHELSDRASRITDRYASGAWRGRPASAG